MQMHKKNYLLLSVIILSQLHSFFTGYKERVDWFIFIDYTRRIDYAVMYMCKHLIYLVYAYCLLFPYGIKKDTKVFIFILAIADFIHYITLSHIGFPWFKLLGVLCVFLIYKNINNDENR